MSPVAVRGNYETGNQAFSKRLRFLTIRGRRIKIPSQAVYSRVNFTYFDVANTPIDTASMTAVAVQPTTRRYRGIVNLSITFLLDAICMMTAISGAAKMPFKTAAQNRAC